MAKRITNEVKDVLNTANVDEKESTISKEAEAKLEQQLKKDAKSSKSCGGVRA